MNLPKKKLGKQSYSQYSKKPFRNKLYQGYKRPLQRKKNLKLKEDIVEDTRR